MGPTIMRGHVQQEFFLTYFIPSYKKTTASKGAMHQQPA
jgi:hypothetical protein